MGLSAADINADVRLSTREGKVKAFADVMIPLNGDGFVKLSGFTVIESIDVLRVGMPSRKGLDRYFDTVTLGGRVRNVVEEAILGEYRRLAYPEEGHAGCV